HMIAGRYARPHRQLASRSPISIVIFAVFAFHVGEALIQPLVVVGPIELAFVRLAPVFVAFRIGIVRNHALFKIAHAGYRAAVAILKHAAAKAKGADELIDQHTLEAFDKLLLLSGVRRAIDLLEQCFHLIIDIDNQAVSDCFHLWFLKTWPCGVAHAGNPGMTCVRSRVYTNLRGHGRPFETSGPSQGPRPTTVAAPPLHEAGRRDPGMA